MDERKIQWAVIISVFMFALLLPELGFAQWSGGGLESKMQGLTSKLVGVVLPLMSILGLVYAVILALTGDAGAKSRITMVIVCSVVGFLAPHIINWFKAAAGP